MTGTVSAGLEPRLALRLRSVSGAEQRIEAVLDTGFDGELSLPPDIIEALDAPWAEARYSRLADGSEILTDVYEVDVEWDGQWTTALAEALPSALVGTRMCEGYQVIIHFEPSGGVEIEPIR